MEREVENKKNVHYDLGGRVALITGAASGLGLATAKRFLRSNCKVVLSDYDPKIEEIADDMECFGIRTNVTNEDDVKKAVQFCVDKYGSLDIIVCSAGIGGANNTIAEETLENWNLVNSVDYTGIMLCNKHAIRQFRKQGNGGVVINLASMFGLVGIPSNVAYSAAKGGVVNLTKAAGTAYAAEGIRVNCVCPGVINTPLVPENLKKSYRSMHPMHRIGEAFEIAAIITFLASDDARFITGAAIPVDGGYTVV